MTKLDHWKLKEIKVSEVFGECILCKSVGILGDGLCRDCWDEAVERADRQAASKRRKRCSR